MKKTARLCLEEETGNEAKPLIIPLLVLPWMGRTVDRNITIIIIFTIIIITTILTTPHYPSSCPTLDGQDSG